jgi:site-specific DNA-methyltransferase (adenine-specific)
MAAPMPELPRRGRRPTSTARFGSSRRESHDASAFYERFVPPVVDADATVAAPSAVDVIYTHDARDMSAVPSCSVALVVTSPPYFAGKEYEASLGENGVPGSYFEYLTLLRDVFAECARVLEPGGRIAVNVANLGRRPFRSLAGDVTTILQDLGLLLRGEIVWVKGRASTGSCAWGSFQDPRNPVLRDVTERIVVAGKGRFDRALDRASRSRRGLPARATITRDEFLEATTDLWEIPAESARRVGHPAPFPVALPQRLIELYTYERDVVLDPFMGSGSAAVAAVRTGRHFVGFETDPAYVARAMERVEDARSVEVGRAALDPAVAAAVRDGLQAKDVAHAVLTSCGFTDVRTNVKVPGLGFALSFVACDAGGEPWAFDVCGSYTTPASGLRRTDVMWKAIGRAAAYRGVDRALRLVLLTTDAPAAGAPSAALRAVTGPDRPVFAVVELLDDAGQARLRAIARGGR